MMATHIGISENLIEEARIYGEIDKRTLAGQIEHWAKIGKCAEQNPDLTYSLIKDILTGIEELDKGESTEYTFG
jgi:hypothetical protein